jgi:hypothetical protein
VEVAHSNHLDLSQSHAPPIRRALRQQPAVRSPSPFGGEDGNVRNRRLAAALPGNFRERGRPNSVTRDCVFHRVVRRYQDLTERQDTFNSVISSVAANARDCRPRLPERRATASLSDWPWFSPVYPCFVEARR